MSGLRSWMIFPWWLYISEGHIFNQWQAEAMEKGNKGLSWVSNRTVESGGLIFVGLPSEWKPVYLWYEERQATVYHWEKHLLWKEKRGKNPILQFLKFCCALRKIRRSYSQAIFYHVEFFQKRCWSDYFLYEMFIYPCVTSTDLKNVWFWWTSRSLVHMEELVCTANTCIFWSWCEL